MNKISEEFHPLLETFYLDPALDEIAEKEPFRQVFMILKNYDVLQKKRRVGRLSS